VSQSDVGWRDLLPAGAALGYLLKSTGAYPGHTLAMEGAAIRDFGQKLDLCTRLRDILAAYPDGSSVLQELLQNADDAGASQFKLLIDLRTHATETLAFPATAPFQGPAIFAFNDAEFTDTDLASIQQVGGSLKAGNAVKTGRFGACPAELTPGTPNGFT